MTEIIWLNVLIVGLIAAAAAVVLYFTAKKFAVENNPLVDKIAVTAWMSTIQR